MPGGAAAVTARKTRHLGREHQVVIFPSPEEAQAGWAQGYCSVQQAAPSPCAVGVSVGLPAWVGWPPGGGDVMVKMGGRVNVAVARKTGVALPPVELIKVGEEYYVRDGHHRVSVAHAFGECYIDAVVFEW